MTTIGSIMLTIFCIAWCLQSQEIAENRRRNEAEDRAAEQAQRRYRAAETDRQFAARQAEFAARQAAYDREDREAAS
jgi:hypothetical protein